MERAPTPISSISQRQSQSAKVKSAKSKGPKSNDDGAGMRSPTSLGSFTLMAWVNSFLSRAASELYPPRSTVGDDTSDDDTSDGAESKHDRP
jgi:hypothetical protein